MKKAKLCIEKTFVFPCKSIGLAKVLIGLFHIFNVSRNAWATS